MLLWTTKERKAISDAFDALAYALSTTSMDLPHEWKAAFKIERKHCNDATAARGVMLERFMQGYDDLAAMNLRDLYSYRSGSREAILIGAYVAGLRNSALSLDDITQVREALLTRSKAMRRFMDAR